MTDQAARDGDPTKCPHDGYALDATATRDVNINGLRAATASNPSGCPGKFIVTGAGSVNINGQPAARANDRTTDGGVLLGSDDVFIGGPRVGANLGSSALQTQACFAAASTRANGSLKQGYGNCGLESWRNVLNRERARSGLPPLTQDELLQEALRKGLATDNPGANDHGSTWPSERVGVLREHGVEAEALPQSLDAIIAAVGSGRAVSVTIHPHHWGDYVTEAWWHEVAVTGVEYDAAGRVVALIINDTGLGECGYRIAIEDMKRNMPPGQWMTVSKKPLWK